MGLEGILMEIESGEPIVELVDYSKKPFDTAVSSARTCYSPKFIYPDEVTEKQRERIGKSIYEAGHHTPFQHIFLSFKLENVSRQWVWSFLHSHPFYNSSQSSQRYVYLDKARVFIPPIGGEALEVYKNAIEKAWIAYNKISELLIEDNYKLMESIGRIKGQSEKQIRTESEKKAIENARYVIPIAAFTSMRHTINGLEFKRYVRMANACDCPYESKLVIEKMIEEVRKVDPDFVERIHEETLEEDKLIENRNYQKDNEFNKKFDSELGNYNSKLIAYTENGEEIIADAVREVLHANMNDEEAIDLILNPKKNNYLLETLNLSTHSPLMRALNHVNYTFKKKISHTADSQDQRHRTTPASRPLLSKTHTKEPDYITPEIISKNKEALEIYEDTMKMLWDSKNKLIEMGVPDEYAIYLLPNATAIRFTESGSLLYFLHKWRLRSCFNAQLEIFNCTMDEIKQVSEVHPNLAKYIGPPCKIRYGSVEEKDPEGPCPEGVRWCGIPVWLNFPNVKRGLDAGVVLCL